MDPVDHFSPSKSAVNLSHRIVSFCDFLRNEGFNIGVQESLDALIVAEKSLLEPQSFFLCMRSLCCASKQEWDRFDFLFQGYWKQIKGYRHIVRRKKRKRVAEKKASIPLLMISANSDKSVGDQGKSTAGANAIERLKKTDFSQVPMPDRAALEALVLRLSRQMNKRLSKRRKPALQSRQVDLKRTIRKSIGQGGDPIYLAFKSKKKQKNRMVALLDVSGSMDQYSYFFLLFIHALRGQFDALEAFVFSTRLVVMNKTLKERNVRSAMIKASEEAEAWASGTRIGTCLHDFNRSFGKQKLQRDTIVLIMSDGLDTDEPMKLAGALAYIKKRVDKIIWLNPLAGMTGFMPETPSMKNALPFISIFASAHNLESLLNLERHF